MDGVNAVDVVHGDPELAAELAAVVDPDDVGVPECASKVASRRKRSR
jgi:hypothetical protein